MKNDTLFLVGDKNDLTLVDYHDRFVLSVICSDGLVMERTLNLYAKTLLESFLFWRLDTSKPGNLKMSMSWVVRYEVDRFSILRNDSLLSESVFETTYMDDVHLLYYWLKMR